MITDQNGNAVWQWGQDEPFGDTVANQDPNGTGNQFVFNPRFAGQYFDQETGTHYNYFRDCYDPATGRYCESDPIGLNGGINTYLYAAASPLRYSDSSGLDNPSMGPYGSAATYSRSAGTVTVTNSDNTQTTYPAGNNTTSTSRGAWPVGEYPYGYSTTHSDDAPNSAYGSNGNAVYNVPGCVGCGVHSGRETSPDGRGRTGVNHATQGCIRTTDAATRNIHDLINNGDPPTLFVTP